MNFRKSPLLALLFIFAFDLTSTATNIKGFVFDQNKTPLEFINVIVYNATDSSLVKAGVTESNGSFVFENLKIESIYIRTNFIGFEDFTSEIIDASAKETIDLGTIELVPASQQTATVNVVYKKPLVEVQADKTVFNVEGTINSAGLDALELLRKAPGVMLDNDNNISIKGRSGIMVYIDGKRSPLDADGLKAMLKNMQSSNIESIEIITNPSSNTTPQALQASSISTEEEQKFRHEWKCASRLCRASIFKVQHEFEHQSPQCKMEFVRIVRRK
jgi:iron complex outermembrane receptor protein